jgi:hypothetical protein
MFNNQNTITADFGEDSSVIYDRQPFRLENLNINDVCEFEMVFYPQKHPDEWPYAYQYLEHMDKLFSDDTPVVSTKIVGVVIAIEIENRSSITNNDFVRILPILPTNTKSEIQPIMANKAYITYTARLFTTRNWRKVILK